MSWVGLNKHKMVHCWLECWGLGRLETSRLLGNWEVDPRQHKALFHVCTCLFQI